MESKYVECLISGATPMVRPVSASSSVDQREHLLERRHLVEAVVRGVARPHLRQPLLGAEGLELGQREVLGEPAGDLVAVDGLGRPAVEELGVVGDVGGAADLVLVAGDEHAVLGGDQVGLDVVGALLDGELVRRERVLGAVAGRAAVAEDERLVELGDRTGGERRPARRGAASAVLTTGASARAVKAEAATRARRARRGAEMSWASPDQSEVAAG